jgi:serine/threonine protein kinase
LLSIFKSDSPYSIEIEPVEDIFQTGKIIQGFTVGEEVYRGGMAVLYSATKSGIEKPILLKVPRVGRDQPVESLIAFETELTVFKAPKSPYAPEFIGFGTMAKNPFIAMERVTGETLESMIQKQGTLSIDIALKIASNVAQAIQNFHSQEVIHLDLKPDNIIIRDNYEVTIIRLRISSSCAFS